MTISLHHSNVKTIECNVLLHCHWCIYLTKRDQRKRH